jgi:hypothetical protein
MPTTTAASKPGILIYVLLDVISRSTLVPPPPKTFPKIGRKIVM